MFIFFYDTFIPIILKLVYHHLYFCRILFAVYILCFIFITNLFDFTIFVEFLCFYLTGIRIKFCSGLGHRLCYTRGTFEFLLQSLDFTFSQEQTIFESLYGLFQLSDCLMLTFLRRFYV